MTLLITLAIAALTLRALCRDAVPMERIDIGAGCAPPFGASLPPRAPEPEFLAVRAKAKPKVARKRP